MEDISDSEALHLIKMAKRSVWAKAMPFPDIGGKLQIPVEAEREKESFFVNINRGRTSSLKVTYQTRARTLIPLARLDVGASHQNPDGMHIGSPHLHIYREGFADKWAYELHSLPEHLAFAIPARTTHIDAWFNPFLDFCNISHDNTINWTVKRLL